MVINKAKLQSALAIVKPGLAARELIDQSTSFVFMDGMVVTYNDEICIAHPLEAFCVEGAVKADKLYAFLSKIKTEEISLDVVGNELCIIAGRSEVKIPMEAQIKLPSKEAIGAIGNWNTLPENFLRLMSFAMGSCSTDFSKPKFTCVHVGENGIIEGTDGYKITHCKLGVAMPVSTFLIPANSVVTMLAIEPTQIAEGKGWIHFRTEMGTILSCRTFEDSFPDTSPHLVITGEIIPLPRTIKEILERAQIFSKRDHALEEQVDITLEDRRFKIQAGSEDGTFKEEVNIKYDGEPITFAIAPFLLQRIVAETTSCLFCENKLKFEGVDWIYIACLKTVKKTKEKKSKKEVKDTEHAEPF